MLKKVLCILSLVFVLTGCERLRAWHQRHNDIRDAVAEVDGHYLYAEDVTGMIPQGTSTEDSLRIAEKYISQWAQNQLIYSTARRNLRDTVELAQKVERYRRQLIVYTYEQ